ncbi:hypothetical protein ACA910_001931 [Epithemia clementina (nom. ined.)]
MFGDSNPDWLLTSHLTSSAKVICLETSDLLICGTPIGSTGKFCITLTEQCLIKRHKIHPSCFCPCYVKMAYSKLCSSLSHSQGTS